MCWRMLDSVFRCAIKSITHRLNMYRCASFKEERTVIRGNLRGRCIKGKKKQQAIMKRMIKIDEVGMIENKESYYTLPQKRHTK